MTVRAQVLAQCVAEEARWRQAPGRNLVLLFDGTGNILGNAQDTNVVKLLRAIDKRVPRDPHRPTQVVYYDPGVGSANDFPTVGLAARLGQSMARLQGLALGSGAFENIAQSYEFLVREWREGDRLWLFGFSRGAFTARAVAGMVNMFGLVQVPGLALLRRLVRVYFGRPSAARTRFAREVVDEFALGRQPLVHFTGVWDTVETIGSGLLGGLRITNSRDFEDKRFVHVRHALALDETRSKYRPRDYVPPTFTPEEERHRSFDQRWFRGAHADVGGGYARSGLSEVALAWMLREAQACGLRLEPPADLRPDPASPRHDPALDCPFWVWTGLSRRQPGPRAVIDPSALPLEAGPPARRSAGNRWQAVGWALLAVAAGMALWVAAEGWSTGRAVALGLAVAAWATYPVAAVARWWVGRRPQAAAGRLRKGRAGP